MLFTKEFLHRPLIQNMHYVSSSTKIETYHTLAYCCFYFASNYKNMINVFHKSIYFEIQIENGIRP